MAEYVCEISGKSGHVVLGESERVVRCRDCRHGEAFRDSSSYAGMIDCTHFAQWDYYDDEFGIWPVEPDGLCAWGKEREG